jgi:DNA repair exonuclease SbcCD ATPase subunit
MKKMKILELEIANVRGVRDAIVLKPDGNNMAVQGPNGSGKSGVVDALDFLMTGDITRLTGKGTKGITLKHHGKHIDAKPEDAFVKAKIQFDGIDQPVTLLRNISNPKDLSIDPEIDEQIVNDALEIAHRGQHVLSRAEILRFIAAEAGTRADLIQAVLNLNEVEQLRKTFVTIKREADKNVQSEKTAYERSIASIQSTIDLKEFNENELLKIINEKRAVLKGEALEKLDPDTLQKGVSPVADDDKNRVDPEQLKRTINSANEIIKNKSEEIYEKERELRQTVQTLKVDERLKKDLASKRLLSMGISLIDDKTGSCPLCLTPWDTEELKKLLADRQSKANKAEEIETKIKDTTTEISTEVTRLHEFITRINNSCEKLEEKEISEDLKPWIEKLKTWAGELKNSIDDYKTIEELTDDVKTFFTPEKWNEHIKSLTERAGKEKKFTPEQQAWNILTELKPSLKRYLDDREKLAQSIVYAFRAKAAENTYTATKDNVLKNLYDSVNSDFSTYYKHLHGEDENSFYSELKPDGPQLDFKVDFYGRGAHHPRALHSEGHQDSMGLCLYLALNKKISEGKVKLVILDDVVMSIDSSHRRAICKLLNDHFPDVQFVITTHNRTWARQLKTDGVVKSNNMIHFKGWSIDTGPKYQDDTDVWNKIDKDLEDEEVSSAAHKLREHGEYFYENVCDSLKANVPYRSDNRWEFGDYLNGAKQAYKKYLKLAKKSANSWEKEEQVEAFTEIETQANEIIQRTQLEHWGINENVHYTKWKDMGKEDFQPISEAFQDMENLFRCPECQGMIGLNMTKQNPTNIKCPCGNINWNLEMK